MTRPRTSATKPAQLKPAQRTWIDLAACIHHDPAMWDLDNPRAWYRATTICQTCPVKQQCLDDALDNPAASGIYAGIPLDHGKPTSRQHGGDQPGKHPRGSTSGPRATSGPI